MKKAVCALLVLSLLFAFAGCAQKEETKPDAAFAVLGDAESVTVHLYRDGETSLDLEVTDELEELVSGKWEKSDGTGLGDKVLTLTVATQHEITFFDSGKAMIYYGYAGVFEKDRCYYFVTLDSDLESLYNYCAENGTVPETEE